MVTNRLILLSFLVLSLAACSKDSTTGKKSGTSTDAGGESDGATAKGGTGGKTGTGKTGTGTGGKSASGTGGKSSTASGGGGTDDCKVVVKDADCDKKQRPFVFVHGTYGSGDNFAHVAQLLGSNGFCQDRIVAVEYNSLGDAPETNGSLDALIDKVLKDTGFDKVDLAGHSQGTAHCGTYLSDAGHRAKVAHYINFSGVPNVGDVETLSLSSMHDLGNTPHHATGNHVETHTFQDEDHFAVAASLNSFKEVYKYLAGKDPQYTEVQCSDPVMVEGISETFADNVPMTGKIEFREIGDSPRPSGAPWMTVMPDDKGHFGPIEVKRGVAYEMAGYDTSGKIVGYQYYTPFKRTNRLVRLLSPASAGDGSPVGGVVATSSTDHVVRDANHSAIVVRWLGGGFRKDLGASLKVNGMEVLTEDNAGKVALSTASLGGGIVGFFMYDANKNSMTDLGLVYSTSFISFTDVFMDATKPKFIDLTFTAGSEESTAVDNVAKASNWPSNDALINVTFQ